MKRSLLAGVTVVALALSSQAFAQSATVEISPTQRTTIKEYVVKQKVAPVTVRERLAAGVVVPADVRLAPVPSVWGPSFSKYSYVYSDNHVYLVEPSSRKVVQEID